MEAFELTQILIIQVLERTEQLLLKAIVLYRDDRDLENAIDFVQKKVKDEAKKY